MLKWCAQSPTLTIHCKIFDFFLKNMFDWAQQIILCAFYRYVAYILNIFKCNFLFCRSSSSLDYRHERLCKWPLILWLLALHFVFFVNAIIFIFIHFCIAFAPCSTSNPCLSAETGLFSNGSHLVHSEGQSLREFDEKLQSLQKENFNLKLRIFFLEERKEALGQNGGGINSVNATAKCNDDEISKYNIDLKVCLINRKVVLIKLKTYQLLTFSLFLSQKIENEDLRKELQKKQELLCQAAKAIELMEDSQRKQVESSSATIKELAEQIECLQVSTTGRSESMKTIYKILFFYRVKSIHWNIRAFEYQLDQRHQI